MRTLSLSYCLLLTACGPDTATTEDTSSTGATSTGEATMQPTTSADTGSSTPTTGDDATTGDGTTSDATTTGMTTSESTSDGTTGPACLDFSPEDPQDYPEQPHFTCGLAPLCPGDGPLTLLLKNTIWVASDIDRARCMATAMRDRTPGQLHFQTEESDDFHTIEILSEQVIVVDEYHGIGFGFSYDERVTFLKPPEFFADCSIGTGAEIHTCLTQGFTDVCADERGCPN